jgi:sodium transport system permease protein
LSDEVAAQLEQVGQVLSQSPNAWLPFVLIALLPAICEELAFRGFILSGLRHIGHKWWAIGLSAVFFGVAHGMLQQSLMAALTGTVIGFIAVQTGSLLPCMLFHFTHNSLAVLSANIHVTQATYQQYPALQLLVVPGADGFTYGWPLVIAGAALAGALLAWLHRLNYQRTEEETLQEALEQQSAHSLAG